MFITVTSIGAKNWKQAEYLSRDKQINKLQYIDAMEKFSSKKKVTNN